MAWPAGETHRMECGRILLCMSVWKFSPPPHSIGKKNPHFLYPFSSSGAVCSLPRYRCRHPPLPTFLPPAPSPAYLIGAIPVSQLMWKGGNSLGFVLHRGKAWQARSEMRQLLSTALRIFACQLWEEEVLSCLMGLGAHLITQLCVESTRRLRSDYWWVFKGLFHLSHETDSFVSPLWCHKGH